MSEFQTELYVGGKLVYTEPATQVGHHRVAVQWDYQTQVPASWYKAQPIAYKATVRVLSSNSPLNTRWSAGVGHLSRRLGRLSLLDDENLIGILGTGQVPSKFKLPDHSSLRKVARVRPGKTDYWLAPCTVEGLLGALASDAFYVREYADQAEFVLQMLPEKPTRQDVADALKAWDTCRDVWFWLHKHFSTDVLEDLYNKTMEG